MRGIKIRDCAVCRKDFIEKEMMPVTVPKQTQIGSFRIIVGEKTFMLCPSCFGKLEKHLEVD